ncbi:hypothetical protein CHS0354_016507 [Potamilus streckersoni]|uniref:C2H2-type domain-containing protein n=1 Tax=Potamilus streckersoni TaxID=2493646 RepID=A0AAE0SJB3_9BIVA|nr:hypothetical protein CHS0354_016507 [Potamilus streckersoni]
MIMMPSCLQAARLETGSGHCNTQVMPTHFKEILEHQVNAPIKCLCTVKEFQSLRSLRQHLVDKAGTQKKYACTVCCRSFCCRRGIRDHSNAKHPGSYQEKFHRCITCCISFTSDCALRQHIRDKHGNASTNISGADEKSKKSKAIRKYLENYFQTRSVVDTEDKKKSFRFVYERLGMILRSVKEKTGGEVFSTELRKAGSHATGLKVNKADEFDFNIPLNVKVLEVKRNGTVPYIFRDKYEKKEQHGPSPKNMNVDRELLKIPNGQFQIPEGYAVVVVDKNVSTTLDPICIDNHLIPHLLQKRFHSLIKETKLGMEDIDLNREAHGPAITMNMHPPNDHHISVDATTIIDWKGISVSDYGWPRLETRTVLSGQLIDKLINSGCQLTPKGNEFWNVSFSNCESILMKNIDAPGECRKKCHKLLKSNFQTWKSRSKTGYKAISSFIFKHVTFWTNEKHQQPGYWKDSNLDVCYVDTLRELKQSLHNKKLDNYFIPSENILSNRDERQLIELEEEVEEEIRALENIKY